MQSRPEPHWTVMGPAGESCSYQSHHHHHRHHAGSPSDCGRCVECYATAALFSGSYSVWGVGTRLLLRHLVVPPNANVINVSNEVQCGETFRVFNLIVLITTIYRYFEVSVINVILALFSDDPTLFSTQLFNAQKFHSHYVSINAKLNNQASIII